MKITLPSASAALLLVATLPAAVTLAQECLDGSFALQFDGRCTPSAIVDAYSDQVYNAAGATASTCATSASDDLAMKLGVAAGSAEFDAALSALCKSVYDTQEEVPFADAARRGTDLSFEQLFYNGRTNWIEEVETKVDEEDTDILKEDAEQIRSFHEGTAQGRRIDWPGSLPNFDTCSNNAVMCCWPKDRQAGDHNGNCNTPYDENCVDKDVADNTDLCFVDMERGKVTTGYDSDDVFVYPGDNGQGEGAIHCHGFAWSNNEDDHTARYKANNLFYVSMYDHMYQRGYVENVPGAPMCGCVEQMPTVTRSDCTQVDLTETIEMTYKADTNTFTSKLVYVHVDFNACQGINNRNNDLWAYVGRLYYQGDVSPKQYGELGRIITNGDCKEATKYELNRKNLKVGYDHDVSAWTNVAGREALKLHDNYGQRAFAKSLVGNTDPDNTHYGIIYRACQPCIRTHKKIYYRRRTPIPDGNPLMNTILYSDTLQEGNTWGLDFSLHSTYEDAMEDKNPWQCPNDSFNYGATFYGQCSPDGNQVKNQRSRFHVWNEKTDVAYFANKAEADGLQIVPTTAIKGRDWAGGIALQDPVNGTIYMSGSGRDIWWWHDDFNYMPQPVEGDHTVIVHAGSISSKPTPNGWSKFGIMFRTSMESNSAHYSVFLTGSNGVCPQGRLTTGAHPKGWSCVNAGATEAWLKIEKRMDTYTSFVGTQDIGTGDIAWTEIDSREIPGIGESYNVGLAVSSAHWKSQEVVFSDLQVDPYYFPSAAPSESGMPTIYVPTSDIGAVGVTGGARQYDDGSWQVTGSGSDIWGQNDQFRYVHLTPKSGNFRAELLVDSFDYVYSWQKGGAMIRESLETNSKHYSLFMTGSNGIANQWRSSTNGNSGNKNDSNLNSRPVWLSVTKIGNTFTAAYKYENDTVWEAFGEPKTITFASESFYVGIAVTSHVNTKLAALKARELIIEEVITAEPTSSPTAKPSNAPTGSPTSSPTAKPSNAPTGSPINPTNNPTSSPSQAPTSPPSSPPVTTTVAATTTAAAPTTTIAASSTQASTTAASENTTTIAATTSTVAASTTAAATTPPARVRNLRKSVE